MRDPWASLRLYAATLPPTATPERRKRGRYQCGTCQEHLTRADFYGNGKGGLMSRCRQCCIDYAQARHARIRGGPPGPPGRPRKYA